MVLFVPKESYLNRIMVGAPEMVDFKIYSFHIAPVEHMVDVKPESPGVICNYRPETGLAESAFEVIAGDSAHRMTVDYLIEIASMNTKNLLDKLGRHM